MNIAQVARMTNIPVFVLARMRDRKGASLLCGPPFHKMMDAEGNLIYVYKIKEIREWMRWRNCQITAGDAAEILGCTRDDILKYSGIHSFDIRKKEYRGRLVMDRSKNLYIWMPVRKKEKK